MKHLLMKSCLWPLKSSMPESFWHHLKLGWNNLKILIFMWYLWPQISSSRWTVSIVMFFGQGPTQAAHLFMYTHIPFKLKYKWVFKHIGKIHNLRILHSFPFINRFKVWKTTELKHQGKHGVIWNNPQLDLLPIFAFSDSQHKCPVSSEEDLLC